MDAIRVVLADDHATIRDGLKLLCSAQPDIEVIGEAADGAAAVEAAVALKPDVLVMDITMPGLSGLQATVLAKQRAPTVKILTLTRHKEETYLRELLRAGAAGYVLKQSSSADLLAAIRAVAAGRQYVDPALSGDMVDGYLRNQSHTRSSRLSSREDEVLQLIAWGYSNKEVGARLQISVKTVEVHKANGMRKLGMTSRIELVRFALLRGWLQDT